MDRLGLNHTDLSTYIGFLRSPSVGVRVDARLLNLDMSPAESMTGLVGGTLHVDVTTPGTPTRTATIVFADAAHTMDWDSNSPGSGAASVNKMVRVEHTCWVPALNDRVRCPLITGVVRGFHRSGPEVTIDIVGREDLMLGQAYKTRTYPKGMLKTDVIKDMLQFYGGVGSSELYLVPDLTAMLPKPLSITKTSVPWDVCLQLAGSMARQLFFNGYGLPVLRPRPAHPCLAVYEGDQGVNTSDITGEVAVDWALQPGWYNAVEVTGAKPTIRAVAYPPPSHPLHPANMGANGAWIVRMYDEANGHIRTNVEAQARAQQLMNQQLNQLVQIQTVSKVFPMLQERDVIRLQLTSGALNFVLETFSIDLAGTGMSLGFNKKMHASRVPHIAHSVNGGTPHPHHPKGHHPAHHKATHHKAAHHHAAAHHAKKARHHK